jgi:hypothetical protein
MIAQDIFHVYKVEASFLQLCARSTRPARSSNRSSLAIGTLGAV